MDGLLVGTGSLVIPPDENSEALDSHLKFTESGDSGWLVTSGSSDEYYYDGDALRNAATTNNGEEACLQTIVESDNSETIKFHWKVSCEEDTDYLRFYIDGTLQHSITGDQDWDQKSYSISSGIHTLKWVYDDNGGDDGDNCGWVDFVQWSGPSPQQDPSNFQTIDYKHDLYGRRSEKKVDGFSTRYLYDGPQVIAEYDGNNNLLRKFIYGPGIDQPVCMIEVADSNAVYYYHFDALGSVVALSDSAGDTIQTYEYSVFGQVAVEDANHPNPYMFAGRRFDIEIGLYYNRARYYNPFTGRFLQTDPTGYQDGMNWYAYCNNNPVFYTDPSGYVANGDPSKHDPNLRIVFYDGGDMFTNAAKDDYFHYRFDMDDAAGLGMTEDQYVIHIINTVKGWYEGIYDVEKQVTYAGVWFLCHGGFIDRLDPTKDPIVDMQLSENNVLFSDEDKTASFFSNLGDALDNNNGKQATIHLRSCYAGYYNKSTNGDSPLLKTAVLSSGHTVTGCDGTVDYWNYDPPGANYEYSGNLWKASYSEYYGKVIYIGIPTRKWYVTGPFGLYRHWGWTY